MREQIMYYLQMNSIDIKRQTAFSLKGENIVDYIVENLKDKNLMIIYSKEKDTFYNVYLGSDHPINLIWSNYDVSRDSSVTLTDEYFSFRWSYSFCDKYQKLYYTDWVIFDRNYMIQQIRNHKLSLCLI